MRLCSRNNDCSKKSVSDARAAFEKEDFARAYALTDALLKSDEIKEYMPVIDLFALNGDISSAHSFWTEAVESYGPALKVKPENVGLLIRTGNAQRQLKNYEIAEKLYDRAISNQSQNWEALHGYYNCLRRYAAFLYDNHPKIADIKFRKGAELADQMLIVANNEKQKQQSMLAKAALYWVWEKYDVAHATYLEAIQAYPDVQRYQEDIAALLVEMGRFQEGHDTYAALYKVSKEKGSAAFIGAGYAEAAAKANSTAAELEKALSAGLLSISKQPDEPFTYYAVAMVYRAMHRRPDSLKYLRDAEAKEASRDVNIHTYDRTRHLMYKALLREWG